MTPIEWVTFGQMLIKLGAAAANAWADILDKTKRGEPVTVEERKAVCSAIVYAEEVPNSRLG